MISEDIYQDYAFELSIINYYNRNFIKAGKVLLGQALCRNTVDGGGRERLP